jgi:hypothetical protein
MARKKSQVTKVVAVKNAPSQGDVARVLIDVTDVGSAQLKEQLFSYAKKELKLDDNQLKHLVGLVEAASVSTKDKALTQIVNLYK